jgi:hypothetical protein
VRAPAPHAKPGVPRAAARASRTMFISHQLGHCQLYAADRSPKLSTSSARTQWRVITFLTKIGVTGYECCGGSSSGRLR